MSNLTLYTTTAIVLLDLSDASRIIAKYYQPPHAAAAGALGGLPPQLVATNPFATVKEQRAFEKAIWEKTRRSNDMDVILYDNHLVLFQPAHDVILYIVAPSGENEVMLSGLLSSLHGAIAHLLPNRQIEKRAVLENLDLVSLAIDETVDDGIILETDAQAIESRVSRPRADVNELQINEQSIMNAYSTLKERVAQRILQG